MASPCACVARSTSRSRHPAPTCTSLRSGSTVTSRMRDISSVRPRSAIAVPAMLWPPPLMLSNNSWSRGESDRRSDVGGRGRLNHERGNLDDHAVPDQHGIVPARVATPEARDTRLEASRRSCFIDSPTRPPSSPATSIVPAFLRRPSCPFAGSSGHAAPLAVVQLHATPLAGADRLASANWSGCSPSWPKTAGTLDAWMRR